MPSRDRDPSVYQHEFRSGHKVFSGTQPPDTAFAKTLPDPIKVTKSPGPGKGDKPRTFSRPGDEELGKSYCRTFGHHLYRARTGSKCINCGHRCRHPKRVTPEGKYTTFRCIECGFEGKVRRGTKS